MTAKQRDSVEPEADTHAASTKRKAVVQEIQVDLSAPEPPSKRARRALKKGKSLDAKKQDSDDDDDDNQQDDRDDADKSKPRSEHGVWIGNLPFMVTAPDLRKWLVDNSGGVITDESITRIKMPMSKIAAQDRSQKPSNKGFAYIDFEDASHKLAAIALTETPFGGRQLLIKDSKSFEGRPAKAKEQAGGAVGSNGKSQVSDAHASPKIFVGNMSFKTTQDDLTRHFEKCGEIQWAKLATFEDSGKCKGYGWVTFKESEAAAWAVKGFVKIKEEIETEQDFDGDQDIGKDEVEEKKFKMRKWWVNRLLGRELKIELAEDDQTRYKKRFGKGSSNRQGIDRRTHGEHNARHRGDDEDAKASQQTKEQTTRPAVKKGYDIDVARRTGGLVKHTGTKATFDD
ncbi:hypothetical protein CDD81_7214 [Ophiocordyceps australis]|uniref:RRM domain-containing protein n=1 Tax=Ophiocordyceps australis TaxID=1399860 RepID=A0A2C5Y540_9HYPO|nr:hypothetical protein CDD81_7214 [Ophiocordyceps australis]